MSTTTIIRISFYVFCNFYFFIVNAQINLVNNNKNYSFLTPINRDLYHSSSDLIEQVKDLVHRHPDKLSIETLNTGNKGYNADISVVTYCRKRRENDGKSKFRILLSFGQHGRELITTELALKILSVLSEEQFLPNVDPVSLISLDNLVIKVVPIENLNGRKLVEEGDLCERRNGQAVDINGFKLLNTGGKDVQVFLSFVSGRGVDLNRNWSVDWGKKEKDYDPYEENPGTTPFSEPESQIMRKIAISFEPHIWVNVHSGMEALFMPYDHKNTTPNGLPSQRMRVLLEHLNKAHCHKRCMIGSGGGSVGYLAHGTATDYMYDIVGAPMAFTFEIYGDDSASSKDCFKMFNPVDHSTFNRVLNDWSAAFFTIFKLVPSQLPELRSKPLSDKIEKEKGVSIDEYLDGYLVERRNRYGKKMEVLDYGMQEIRTYFRLFLLSSVLLLFMFCSRISKSKLNLSPSSSMAIPV